MVLVVGGGAAAQACVATYREAGGAHPVVMVTADDRPPYFRPHVSKEYLTGDVSGDAIALVDATWYAAHDVDVLTGTTVLGIDVAMRTAAISGGEPLQWDACVLATGSAARELPVPGADDPAVHTLRSAADAERLRAAADGPVLVVGSGFVGCEAAAGLRRLGRDVAMVSDEALPQAGRLGQAAGEMIRRWLDDLGVDVVTGVEVRSLERHGDVLTAELTDERRIDSVAVVAAVGARPRLELAIGAGLIAPDDEGVPVDATMRTVAPTVYAAGDIALAEHEVAGRRLRVEHWGDAEAHGRAAGASLAGHAAPWTSPPGFWSTIGDHTLKHVAWGDGFDEIEVVTSPEGATFWYGQGGVVVGVLTHGHDEDADAAADAVAKRWPMPRAHAR